MELFSKYKWIEIQYQSPTTSNFISNLFTAMGKWKRRIYFPLKLYNIRSQQMYLLTFTIWKEKSGKHEKKRGKNHICLIAFFNFLLHFMKRRKKIHGNSIKFCDCKQKCERKEILHLVLHDFIFAHLLCAACKWTVFFHFYLMKFNSMKKNMCKVQIWEKKSLKNFEYLLFSWKQVKWFLLNLTKV